MTGEGSNLAAESERESDPALELRVLGPIEVLRGGHRVDLPQSKKTRALLAYLAVTRREHRRQRLCELFWDVADDPRGALRWSLSKLRRIVDDDRARRIVADRSTVFFAVEGASVDAIELGEGLAQGLEEQPTDELERLARLARGEFLEGLDLQDFHEFQAWCVAERELARERSTAVFKTLTQRFACQPRRALPYARAWVQADVLDISAMSELLRLLVAADKRSEAEQQLELARRLFRDLGASGAEVLTRVWSEIGAGHVPVEAAPAKPGTSPPAHEPQHTPDASSRHRDDARPPIVGRDAEREQLSSLLKGAHARDGLRVALITGEPGSGKSCLADWLVREARHAGHATLHGRAFEAERGRPYGPWVDALRGHVAGEPDEAAEGRVSIPELFEGDRPLPNQEALFAKVADAIAGIAAHTRGAVLTLDDVQWLDRDSAALLHYVARQNQQRPLFLLLVARSGELPDNDAVLQVVRGLRRDCELEELSLAPLSRDDINELVADQIQDDGRREKLFEACAGNPLYALELARAGDVDAAVPPSLVRLVRERVDGLPAQAADILRWAAILGQEFAVERLEVLSSLDTEPLVEALESLERHALLRVADATEAGSGRYVFAHNIVREAVYSELSQPRRRLMHQRVAHLLEPEMATPAIASEVAHHASLAGEAALGVRACIAAARRSLRVFANGDADATARRGLRLVEELGLVERTALTLELLQVHYAAREPDRREAASRLEELIESALDLGLTSHARLGFHMLAYLRWESSSLAEAQSNMMEAERISRSADLSERALALGEAARCLVLLERNLEQAEALVLEARALGERSHTSSDAICFATAMLSAHRGNHDEAHEGLCEARRMARQRGDRLAEFQALEHLLMLEIDRGHHDVAEALGRELEELGERVRDGSESAAGRALHYLAGWLRRPEDVGLYERLGDAVITLRAADSKHRLCYTLARLARRELERGQHTDARAHAEEALEAAEAIERASETARVRCLLLQIARQIDDAHEIEEQRRALSLLSSRNVAADIASEIEAALENEAS